MGLIRLDVRQTLHRPHESLAVHLKHTLTRKVQASYIMQETAMAFLLRSVAHSRCYRCFFLYIWSVIDEEFISELSFLQPKECLVEMVLLCYLSLSSGWAPLKSRLKKCRKNDKRTPIMYIHEFIPVICWNHISHAGSSWQTCKDTKNWLLHQLAVIEFSQVDMDNYLCYVPLALAWKTKAHRNIIMN